MKKWFFWSLVVLQLVLCVLMELDVIDWPWWCVCMPALVALASIIIYFITYLAMTGAAFLKKIMKR